jgi:hypothetical protein
MFGVLLIGPADILCDVKAERVVAQICGKIRDFDEVPFGRKDVDREP